MEPDKQRRTTKRQSLVVSGKIWLPSEILPWERDLVAPALAGATNENVIRCPAGHRIREEHGDAEG